MRVAGALSATRSTSYRLSFTGAPGNILTDATWPASGSSRGGLLCTSAKSATVVARRRGCGVYDHWVELLSERSGSFADFWTERHLCVLSTVRQNGTVHATPVGVTLDLKTGIARVICSGTSHKARQIRAAGPDGAAVAVTQVDGRRWSTLEGRAVVRDDPDRVADAVRRYTERYREPRVNPQRVVVEITVTKVLGNA